MVVAIEGLIGVGKSTVLKELERRGHTVELEKVEHWSLLPRMYKERSPEICTLFELQIICSLAARSETSFCERSIASALGIFAPKLIEDKGKLALIEQVAAMAKQPEPSFYIFLDAEPELCKRRIEQRARGGETIDLEYLRELREAHHAFLSDKRHVRIRVEEKDSPQKLADLIVATVAGETRYSFFE